MPKTALLYLETLATIGAVAVAVHYLAGLDWPWAIVAGAAASMLARVLSRARSSRPTSGLRS